MDDGPVYDDTHYEVTAYDKNGERLSLNADRDKRDGIYTLTVWEAIGALATAPSHGWMHWDDGDSERIVIASLRLTHSEYRANGRGSVTCSVNTLETIYRTA
jgi:hypothetical protein